MKPLLLSVVLSALIFLGSAIGFAANRITVESIVLDSCLGLENCENEGRIAYLQGKPINEIVYRMCNLQLSFQAGFTCYSAAFNRIPHLPATEILRHYEGRFSLPLLKSYYHLVRRTCEGVPFFSRAGAPEDSALKCWRNLSFNLKNEIEGVLDSQLMGARVPG